MISFKEFIMLLDQTYLEHRFNWRYGQTLMNVLHGVWPKKYNELKERIRYLENLHDSLRKEIRTQRKEIAALREERLIFLNADKTPYSNETI